jgi:predicted 2-oxoglutarate/Fe(II)-dependent dioxygenase YbiX/peroxiredoxin
MTMMPLVPGNPAPLFTARSSNHPRFRMESAAGRHLILLFIGSAGSEASQQILDAMGSYRPLLNDADLALFFVSSDPEDEQRGRLVQQLPGIRIFWDFERQVAALYGLRNADDSRAFLLNPRLQVMANLALDKPQEALRELFNLASQQPASQRQQVSPGFAPVLHVPYVLERDLCRALIQCHERGPSYDSGIMRDEGGRTVVVNGTSHKKRRDHEITDKALLLRLRQCIEWRLVPEIHKAMQFKASRIERYIVACYDESGGFFRAHRDNLNRGTAHRQFAVTINLNAEDYEGGDLVFSEFGALTYRPATGDAVVFSCSLLHEALPVTRGRRYAFLPFLYDDAGARVRQANQAFVGSEPAAS